MEIDIPEETEEERKYNWARRSSIIYKIRLSILYHLRRERFLQLTDKNISAITLATATAAVIVITKKVETIDLVVSAGTAVLSLLPLVFDFAGKSRKHQELTYEFKKLLAECVATGEYWTANDCDNFLGRMIEISIQESAPLSMLVVDCQNRMAKENGGRIYAISFFDRMLMNFFDLDITNVKEIKSEGNAHEVKK